MEKFIGNYMIYIYENGWEYEIYIKNENIIDYCIYSGMVVGWWVCDQKVDIVKLIEGVYKVLWIELIGIDVFLNFMFDEKWMYGIIFFLKWVYEYFEIIVCY